MRDLLSISLEMKSRAVLLVLAAVLNACRGVPDAYAPPEQRPVFQDYPSDFIHTVEMADPDADAHIVQDIFPKIEGSWRWCGQRPTVKIKMRSVENVKYAIDFAVAETTFKDTGPVTLSFYVNGHLLDHVRYTAPGQMHFEKPVPPGWVEPNQEILLAAEIDKVWVSPGDGARLGFIVTRVGLRQ